MSLLIAPVLFDSQTYAITNRPMKSPETSVQNSGVFLTNKSTTAPIRKFFIAGKDHQGSKKISKTKSAKKKVKPPVHDFGPMDVAPLSRQTADTGVGVHREQEGVDRPYSSEVAVSSTISKETKDQGNLGTIDEVGVETNLEATLISGLFQFGLEIKYLSRQDTFKAAEKNEPTQQTTPNIPQEKNRSIRVLLGAGPLVKVNFAPIDTSLNVPFLYVGTSYILDENKSTVENNINYAGTHIRAGGGIHMFLDSNVTFAPKIEIFTEQLKSSEVPSIKRQGTKMLLQLAIFL